MKELSNIPKIVYIAEANQYGKNIRILPKLA